MFAAHSHERYFVNVVGRRARARLEQETIVPLRVELKPFERIVIGETVLVNSGTRTSFLIDGDAPILRERDTITAETANTPAKRLYLCLQTMYLKNDIPRYRTAYQGFLRELRDTNPGARITIDGQPRGTTPATSPNLTAGDHTVVLELAGRKVTQAVKIAPGSTAQLAATIPRR